MNRRVYILLLVTFVFAASNAQKKTITSFIPKDYDTLQTVKGDLNKDGIEDVVLALYHKMENEELENINVDSIPKRVLIILLASKSGYRQVVKTSNALLCKNCGGVFGDPYAGLSITKSVLTISHYGGSAWRWSYNHKFRLQNNNWFLIGQTSHSYWNVKQCEALDDFAGTDFEDVNFVTGQYETKKISEECELLENKKGKRKVQPLQTISKFTIDN